MRSWRRKWVSIRRRMGKWRRKWRLKSRERRGNSLRKSGQLIITNSKRYNKQSSNMNQMKMIETLSIIYKLIWSVHKYRKSCIIMSVCCLSVSDIVTFGETSCLFIRTNHCFYRTRYICLFPIVGPILFTHCVSRLSDSLFTWRFLFLLFLG